MSAFDLTVCILACSQLENWIGNELRFSKYPGITNYECVAKRSSMRRFERWSITKRTGGGQTNWTCWPPGNPLRTSWGNQRTHCFEKAIELIDRAICNSPRRLSHDFIMETVANVGGLSQRAQTLRQSLQWQRTWQYAFVACFCLQQNLRRAR